MAHPLAGVAKVLSSRREEILANWLEECTNQPFHAGRRDQAVADHIPRLFDALVAKLQRSSGTWGDPRAPIDDPALLDAAQNHARARFEQGLQPADVVTEFRILRHEIGRALRADIGGDTPPVDVMGAELLINDAIDGAISLGLQALTSHIEEVREDFLATTIHDTRQPLSTIKAINQMAERALNRADLDRNRLRDYLARSNSEIDQMAELLSTLAEVSRVALGRLSLQIVSCDLNDLVRRAVDRLPPELTGRVQMDLAPGGNTTGDWDAQLLGRVIINLVSNALKYSPADEPIHIATTGEPSRVHLLVRDYGIGLALDDLASLFRRYGRGRGATEHGIEGQGLGLYLSHGIVEAHGGRIWAESDGRGHGTTMHMRLPRSVPPPPGEPSPSSERL